MAKNTKTEITPEFIQACKEKYKCKSLMLVEGEDGRMILLFDPLSSFQVMKKASAAFAVGELAFVESVINDCLILDEDAAATDSAFLNGIQEQFKPILDFESAKIKKLSEMKYELSYNDVVINCRVATRQDLQFAETKNKAREPYMTSYYVLERIIDSEQKHLVRDLEMNDPKTLISFLAAVDEIKERVAVTVKKL